MAASGDRPADNPFVDGPPDEFTPIEELDPSAAEHEAEHLREAVRYHDYRYYVANDPAIADSAYDRLFDRLRALEDAFDLQVEDSPTRRVGGEPLDQLDEVEHVAPMLSIDSSVEADDVRAFDDRVRQTVDAVEYVCEPKYDGLSVEVVYVDGVIDRAATRGDGTVGEDVTANVRTIPTVPQRLRGDPPGFLAVRGEIYMPLAAFQSFNRDRIEAGDDPFANPRNAAAGSLRQLDPSVTAERPLECVFFDILDADERAATNWAERESLPSWGLRTSDRGERLDDIEAFIAYRDELLEARDGLDYEIDGAVAKVNDRDACAALGRTARAPRWTFAYKFPPRSEVTTVRDVVVQVGRTGRLTPVALLDPVDVGGVTVSRASLHNPALIEELGVNIGDRVRVRRAGDVIPEVAAVVEKETAGTVAFPDECPVCGGPVERDGPLAFCSNGLSCPAQLRRAIQHYASRDALDIEGLGPERVDQLMQAGLVSSIPDLYELTEDDLAALEGWGETSARNLVEELEAGKEPPLPGFLVALGIPEVGPTVARDLALAFGSLDALMAADREALEAVDGVGATMADAITGFFEADANRDVIAALREHGVEPEPVEVGGGELDGLTLVFTGSLDAYTRDESRDLVESHGGRVTGSVSSVTDYLVVGEDPGATKREDAAANDVDELDEAGFLALLEDRGVST